MNRNAFFALALALVGAGLLLRLGPWRLPLSVHHFGGGFLWGAMLFTLTAALRPPGWTRLACVIAALTIVVGVEAARLLHTEGLDAFRRTLAGQILLGRIFSPWNMLVDGLGTVFAAAVTPRPS